MSLMTRFDTSRPYIIIGGGGHAKVLIDTLQELGADIIGYTDIKELHEKILGVPCLGSDDEIFKYNVENIYLVNGLGSTGDNSFRKKIYKLFTDKKYYFPAVISPSALLSKEVKIYSGVQIMRGVFIQPSVILGENSVVNTGAVIDHDCIIGKHVHIAPGVTISGGVSIGEMSHIGTGAKIINGISIGREVLVGAGAVVISDVSAKTCVKGVPAK